MATISVIIVNYNGRAFLGDLFRSLAGQSRRADDTILVDNASTDGSTTYVEQEFPWVRVVRSPSNVGFCEGNNVGAACTESDFIALLNPDAIADCGWLAGLEEYLLAEPSAGVAVSKILVAREPSLVEEVGAEFNDIGHCWGRGFRQLDRGQFDEPEEVAAATACAMMIRRRALAGSLFDPELFMYYEELELTLRLRGRGWRIGYVPSSIVYHCGSESVNAASSRPLLFKQFYGNRNRLKILAKYYPARLLARNLPFIVLSILYWDAYFLLKAGPRFLLHALSDQATFTIKGLRERDQQTGVRAGRWLPWMTKQSAITMYRMRSR